MKGRRHRTAGHARNGTRAAIAPRLAVNDNSQGGGKETGQPPKTPEERERLDAEKPTPRWPFVVAGAVVLVFVLGVLWLIFGPRADVTTDDAYIDAHFASIAPRVSGQVVLVLVDDTQFVKAGQLLVALDPRDYQTAVASAEAALARDKAQLADATASVLRQPSLINEQDAQALEARARVTFATPDATRFTNLAVTGAGTVQQRQQAVSSLHETQAQLAGAVASSDAARRQLDVLMAQRDAAAAAVKAEEAELRQARLNLSYTRIFAPVDGMVAARSVQVGNVVSPGAVMMTVVPLEQVYVTANYLETDLAHVRRGQHAKVHVDAYNIDLDGWVTNVGAASGVSFSPIQPNNATGNFTKIVQRIPVRIDFVPNQPLEKLLRVGFSVETTIHTGLEDVVGEQRYATRRLRTQ